MNVLTRPYWQLALVASGLLAAIGGSMHPDVAAAGNTAREELAVMTADDAWVPGHTLLAVSVALLALGLWGALRSGRWPGAALSLKVGIIAILLYLVEAVMHTAAAVDAENLAHDHGAPVAMTHLGLAAVFYPISGVAIVWMANAIGAEWGRLRVLSLLGIVGGCVHAVVVPMTLLLTDTDTTPLFAIAGMTIASWSITTGLIGLMRPAPRRTQPSGRSRQEAVDRV